MPRSWPLVARGAEVRGAAAAVRAGAGVALTGPAGVGRTRLLAEVVHVLDVRRYAVLRVRGATAVRDTRLGAFAPLLPDAGTGPDWAADALLERVAARRAVLCVDDAHLLDDASAALVHRLVARREAVLLAAVRDDEPLAPAVSALWTDDPGVRLLPVRPLDAEAVKALVEGTLGDVIDSASLRRLHELTRGDLVLLREVLRDARASGALRRLHGVWQWRPAAGAVPRRRRDLVDRRLADLDDDLRTALELVALAEPLELELVDRLGLDEALTELERRGLVELHDDGVRPAHPLHGEAARAACPPMRTRRHHRVLAAALADLTADDPDAPVARLARWELDGGRPGDPGRLVAAAREAIARGDVPLAERLARAALTPRPSVPALTALLMALVLQLRHAEARAVLERFDGRVAARDDGERFALASARLGVRGAGVDAPDVADPGLRQAWDLQVAMAWLGRGDAGRAAALLEPLQAGPTSPHVAAGATVATGALLLVRGEPERAARVLGSVGPEVTEPARELPTLALHVAHLHFLALLLGGELPAAVELVRRRRADVVGAGWPAALGIAALCVGQLAQARGRLTDAETPLREARAHFDGGRSYWGPVAVAELALVAGQQGRARDAEELYAEAAAARAGAVEVARPMVDLARTWVVAAGHEPARAAATALAAADRCAADGVPIGEVVALHDAVRLGAGERVADRLAAQPAASRFGRLAAAHAAAVREPDALLAVADAFRAADMVLLAAEATAQAAELHVVAGRTADAATLLRRAAAWCGDADTPALRRVHGVRAPRLTAREREVGRLAAGGLSSREIAERLVTSVRTVDNHLGAVYAKLGVPGRTALAAHFARPAGG